MPGVEHKEGYIALCTAQGIKWIPVDDPAFSGQALLPDAQADLSETMLSHSQVLQHCTACVPSSANDDHSSIPDTLRDDSGLYYPPSSPVYFHDVRLEYPENHVVSHILSRAPPHLA